MLLGVWVMRILVPESGIQIKEHCRMKEDVVTTIKKAMLRWFSHKERMDDRRLTKGITEQMCVEVSEYVIQCNIYRPNLWCSEKGQCENTNERSSMHTAINECGGNNRHNINTAIGIP